MSNGLGFGILGAGLVCPFHANAIRDAQGGELIAICDPVKERADKQAAEFNCKAYYDEDEMLADDRIHVVNIATPNHLHHASVLKCAEASKHVLTEKPPAMSLKQTDEMIEACKKAGVKLGCTVQCRIRDSIKAMKSSIDSGRFGQLLEGDVYIKWFRSTEYYQSEGWRSRRQSGAGVTVNQGFHYIDLLQHLVGPVKRIQARMTNIAHPDIDVEDTTQAFIEYENGALGVVQMSTALWPGTDLRLEINGEEGTAIMIGERMQTWKFRDERPEDEKMRNLGDASQATGATGAADFGYKDHQVVVQDMIDAIQEDREVVIPVSSVRHSVEIVLAMFQSAHYGRPVELPIQDDESIW